jgi:ribose 1,5-bisphosphokinase
VVANVSRTVVHQARDALSPVRVIEITAPPALLRERLQARNREDVGDRLSREIDSGADVTIVNDGPLAPAIAAFLAALNG